MMQLSEGWRILIALGLCGLCVPVRVLVLDRFFPIPDKRVPFALNSPADVITVLTFVVIIGLLVWRPKIIQSRWRARGQCLICGYDLTLNQSGVCSECGSTGKPGKESGK